MSSYTHSCVSCGQQMAVHERYFGRTLRCRGCGEGFLADPNGGSAADQPSEMTHTCLACGTEMTVAERYFGRSLKCTECGEEFSARPPVSASPPTEPEASPDPVVDHADDPQARVRRRRRLVLAMIGVVVTASIVWWLGGNRGEGFGSSMFTTVKARAEIGQLFFEEAPTVPVALDRDSVAVLAKIAETGEGPSARQAFESPEFLQVSAGTRVRVIETYRGGQARVRVLNGPQNSRIVWVPIAWVK